MQTLHGRIQKNFLQKQYFKLEIKKNNNSKVLLRQLPYFFLLFPKLSSSFGGRDVPQKVIQPHEIEEHKLKATSSF